MCLATSFKYKLARRFRLGGAAEAIKRRHIENCAKVDPVHGDGVARTLGPWARNHCSRAGRGETFESKRNPGVARERGFVQKRDGLALPTLDVVRRRRGTDRDGYTA